jgi:hypothetical protein
MPKLVNGKHPGGRPQVEIDLAKVEMLAKLHASDQEIATFLGISRNSIKRVKNRKAYQEAIARGRAQASIGLRKVQWEAALSGDRTMMIFLGKAVLGQSDNSFGVHIDPVSEVKLTVKRPKPPTT